MLRKTVENSPSLIRLFDDLYSKGTPYLRMGEDSIRSSERTQQGDPASGFLFALEIHPIVIRIETERDIYVQGVTLMASR